MIKKKRVRSGSFGDTRTFPQVRERTVAPLTSQRVLTRKGFVIQFNWIFILIAGAIFLAFFVAFAFRYSSLQEEKTQLEILRNLDLAITSLQVSPFKTTTSMNFPLPTTFLCNPQAISIANTQYPTSNLIVAPQPISQEAIFASFPLSLPFKIATFTLVLQKKPKYIIVHTPQDKEFIETLQEDLALLPIEFKQGAVQEQPGQPGRTYLYLNQQKKNSISLTESTITFPSSEPLPYYSNAHLYALLFSPQPECTHAFIQKQLNQQTQQLLKKLAILESPECSYIIMQEKLAALSNNPSQENQLAVIQANKALINKNCPGVF